MPNIPDNSGVMFDYASAQQIAKVVKAYNQLQPTLQKQIRSPGTSPEQPSFYAQITNSSSGSYSWQMMNVVQGVLTVSSPLVSDSNFSASEINGNVANINDIVNLHWAGLDSSGNPKYLFSQPSGMVAVAITSNTGTGQYQGTIYSGTATNISGTGLTTGATCIVLNLCEQYSTASAPFLTSGSQAVGAKMGRDTSTGYPIIWVSQLYGYVCPTGG